MVSIATISLIIRFMLILELLLRDAQVATFETSRFSYLNSHNIIHICECNCYAKFSIFQERRNISGLEESIDYIPGQSHYFKC